MKKHLAAIGIALSSVVGGVALGATMFAPTIASAQTADTGESCPPPHHPRAAQLETAADAIGITVDDLRAQLDDGTTIAGVAAANGIDVQTVVDALVADVREHLDAAVADGHLTRDQADQRLANATERITARVNGEAPPARPEGRGRPEAPDAP
jgi:nucleoside 2-deoxyribosyltransferase